MQRIAVCHGCFNLSFEFAGEPGYLSIHAEMYPAKQGVSQKELISCTPCIQGNRVIVKRGPKENRQRPSIDALFRSATASDGSRVIGVVLSGVLNDGTFGLWSIKRQGGPAIIQDPEDSEQPEMPKNVLEYVEVNYISASKDFDP